MSTVDDDTKRLIDSIFIEKLLRGRRTPMDDKILDGARLFDMTCGIARGSIRSQFPNFTDDQVDQELDRRLAITRRIADGNIYRNVEEPDEV